MNHKTLRTPEEIKRDLARQGKTIADLARELGLRTMIVYDLLRGRTYGTRGESYEAAKALGLISGEDDATGSQPTPQTVSIVHTSHPLACLLGLPHVDALSMDDGQIAPTRSPA